ncbi:MAG: cyclic nucleotide-binding domain-containing protein [Myxococcales bacterium]|nr:cyclic nucleotide-binding domain-containing protein [Myxococcales bacterium]
MRVDAWAHTDVGRLRKHNEDAWLIDDRLQLYAVADGMGGHAAGEVASSQALKSVQESIAKSKDVLQRFVEDPSNDNRMAVTFAVEHAIVSASASIHAMAQRDEKRRGMGTTLSMLLIVGRKAFMAHVGDSRIYLLRSGFLHQLSEDHSYLWEQVKKGVLSIEEAKRSPYSNVITRAVGITETVQVDTLVLDVLPNDRFLACSDGLHGYLRDEQELVRHLEVPEVEGVADRLVDLANERGGKDNITAVVLQVSGAADDPSALDILDRIETLQQIPLFRHLTYKELVKVLNQTNVVAFERGQQIIEEDSVGEELFVVLSGEVDVMKAGQLITTLGERVHFGEMALVDRSPRSASVVARADTRLLSLSRRSFFNLVKTEPVLSTKLLWSFVQVLSHRLRATNDALSISRAEMIGLDEIEDPDPTTEIQLDYS